VKPDLHVNGRVDFVVPEPAPWRRAPRPMRATSALREARDPGATGRSLGRGPAFEPDVTSFASSILSERRPGFARHASLSRGGFSFRPVSGLASHRVGPHGGQAFSPGGWLRSTPAESPVDSSA
jgi:hypothetical protein